MDGYNRIILVVGKLLEAFTVFLSYLGIEADWLAIFGIADPDAPPAEPDDGISICGVGC